MLDGIGSGEILPFRVPSLDTDHAHDPGRGQPAAGRRRPRVCIYSHDTYGLGHLRRNLAIAEHLLGRGFEVKLMTGSPVIRAWDLPAGLRVQPLPPVVKVGAEKYASRCSHEPFAMVKGYRQALILKTIQRFQPDFLLIDHAPAGMGGELLPALALIRREMPGVRVIVGLRDILDSPETVRRLWAEEEVYALLEQAYHEILIYGSRDVFDAVAAYAMPQTVSERVHYVGYIARPVPAARDAGTGPWPAGENSPAGGHKVLVTAGGGGDGQALMDGYLRAIARLPAGLTRSLIVTGPLMPPEQVAVLNCHVGGRRDVAILPYTTDLPKLMVAADLVVSMAGYNTSVEILRLRKKSILVPRAAPREEQKMRAGILNRLGLAWTAAPGEGLDQRLADLLPEVLAGSADGLPDFDRLDMSGARRLGDLLAAWLPAEAMANDDISMDPCRQEA